MNRIGLNSSPPPARGPVLAPGNLRGLAVATGVGVVSGVAAGLVLSRLNQPSPGVSVYSGTVLGLPCYPVTDPSLPVCVGISATGGRLKFTNMDTGKIVSVTVGANSTYQAALATGVWSVALTLSSGLSPIITPQMVVSQGGQSVTQDFVYASGIA